MRDTADRRYRCLNFFPHECYLEVRAPASPARRAVRQVDPPSAGKRSGFTLLFDAQVLGLCQVMPLAALARLVGED